MNDALKYKIHSPHWWHPTDEFQFPSKICMDRTKSGKKSRLNVYLVYSKKSDSVWCFVYSLSVSGNRSRNLGLFIINTSYHNDAKHKAEDHKNGFGNPRRTLFHTTSNEKKETFGNTTMF